MSLASIVDESLSMSPDSELQVGVKQNASGCRQMASKATGGCGGGAAAMLCGAPGYHCSH
eukprot:3769812-Rhodomonas_salina.4